MSHKATAVYAVDVDTFSKLIEGDISVYDIELYCADKRKRRLRPTGRTYEPGFFGPIFIECMEIK